MNDLKNIVSHFKIEGRFESATAVGSGHINDTYLVTTIPFSAPDYILQRINHAIFRNVPELISNIVKVTRHLKQRLLCKDSDLDWFHVIGMVETRSGQFFLHDPQGMYWRMYDFVPGSRSFDVVENRELSMEAGKAFGIFHHLTSDMNAGSLFEILPEFHHIGSRLEAFRRKVATDPAGRVAGVAGEIAFAELRAGEMHTILRLAELGRIPVRVTHNDTKFNNVLFNKDNKAIAVVDLDTVMAGTLLYDFGDAIRTGANTGAEDEADLSKVQVDLGLFEAYARGYLEITGDFLAREELDHLAFSARYMTYLIGLRFLTDHIDGDRYYKIAFPGHNLQRARAQFRLLETMERESGAMQEIIRSIRP